MADGMGMGEMRGVTLLHFLFKVVCMII